MLQEFKAFAMRGSLLDLAMGIILGTAFGAIIAHCATHAPDGSPT